LATVENLVGIFYLAVADYVNSGTHGAKHKASQKAPYL
jgi:hypothetical protein